MSPSFNSKKSQMGTTSSFMRGTGSDRAGGKTSSGIHQSRASDKANTLSKNPMTQTRNDVDSARGPGQPADSGPLKSLSGPRRGITTVFPLNIRAVDHYITIGAFEERHFPAFGEPRKNSSIIQKVILPMPSNLQAGYNQEYQNEQIGITGQVVGSAMNKQNFGGVLGAAGRAADSDAGFIDKGSDLFNATSDLAAGTIRSISANINKGVALASALKLAESGAAGIAGTLGGGVAGGLVAAGAAKGVQAFAAARGLAANPHTSVIYDSPQMRAFNMEWELRPKNQMESLAIARIIAFFKYYSSPSFKSGMSNHFFEYPNQFKLKVKHDEFLFAFGDCVLTAFNVDYHGEGTPIYYDASGSIRSGNRRLKAPAVVRISTAWQETSIVTKEAVENQGR
tara:strand:+ start:405 stop:1592 length:1188 start_codon:yes stop_codon:yes gene_type:complete